MKRLMIEHAFGFARTVWFEVGRDNVRSRRAMEKIGATLAGDRVDPPGSAAAPHVLFRIDRAARGG
jgi:RimJ/RimL family protein N-acetyltransferase